MFIGYGFVHKIKETFLKAQSKSIPINKGMLEMNSNDIVEARNKMRKISKNLSSFTL